MIDPELPPNPWETGLIEKHTEHDPDPEPNPIVDPGV